MTSALRLLAAAALLFVSAPLFADDEAMILVAHPAFRDLEYRQTVLIAAPAPNGGHVGVILNRPTRRSLGSLFPEHEPSKKVVDPVFYGGPFSRGALVALVHADQSPGSGSVPLMNGLYLAFRANTIDHVIETTPNDARYFVGYVGGGRASCAAKSIAACGRWSTPTSTRCSARTPKGCGKSSAVEQADPRWRSAPVRLRRPLVAH